MFIVFTRLYTSFFKKNKNKYYIPQWTKVLRDYLFLWKLKFLEVQSRE